MNPALQPDVPFNFLYRKNDRLCRTGWRLGNIVDTVSGATPLAAMKSGETVDLLSLFIGNVQGTIGETSALAILIGAAILLIRGIIDFRIPVAYILTFSVFALIFGGHGLDFYYLLCQLCAAD